jgi:DNA-binding Lrp family transcriptional regulator
MNMAYVLINTDMGSESIVGDELKKISEVKEVHGVYGVYDLIVKLEAATLDELKEVISTQIRGLEAVRSTLTMIVM